MATAIRATESRGTVAELLKQLGDIPPDRVLLRPAPGTATEQDVVAIHDRENRLCELVDGFLVEKAMGFEESGVAVLLCYYLVDYLRRNPLGRVYGADGTMRLFPGLVRIPDVSFVSWDRHPKGQEVGAMPDLVVEILSQSNTREEMDRKLGEYFAAGVRLVWYVDPKKQTATIYTSPRRPSILHADDHLDGGDVLPGFRLSLREWFEEAGRRERRPE